MIDSHVHLFPDRLARAIRQFFRDHIPAELVYPLDNRAALDVLSDEGVTTVWNLPYAHKAGVAGQLNRSMAQLGTDFADHSVHMVVGCTVHPDDPDPVGDLRTAAVNGARVLKLHCSVGDYEPDDPRLSSVFDQAGLLNMPVVIHAGRAVNGSTDSNELDPIATVAAHHRDTTIVLAHFGHHALASAIRLLDSHPNLIADLTPVLDQPIPVPKADLERLAHRLLFGSDAPNTGCTVTELVNHLDSIGISDMAKQQITHDNAAALVEG